MQEKRMTDPVKSFLAWCNQENLQIQETRENPYGTQFLVKDSQEIISIQFYRKGTVLVQGKPSALLDKIQRKYPKQSSSVNSISCIQDHIGMDEAGKGDYFGPLVISCAYVQKEAQKELLKAGVKDSKEIPDKKILQIYHEYQNKVPHETLVLMPEQYNVKYTEFLNLNNMLAWAHAQTLEQLLARVPATIAIADQFANPRVLEKKLFTRGKQIKLIQQPKAESDIAVAMASIFARALFLQGLETLQKQYNFSFPKGAYEVEQAGMDFVQKFGKEKLSHVAKVHFKTTQKIK